MWGVIVSHAVAVALAAGGEPERPAMKIVGIENGTITLPANWKSKPEMGMAGDRPTVRITLGGATLEAERLVIKGGGSIIEIKAEKGKDGKPKYSSTSSRDPDSPSSYEPRPDPGVPGFAEPPLPPMAEKK